MLCWRIHHSEIRLEQQPVPTAVCVVLILCCVSLQPVNVNIQFVWPVLMPGLTLMPNAEVAVLHE